MENKIRLTLNEIYFGKTRDIVNDLRYIYKYSVMVITYSPVSPVTPVWWYVTDKSEINAGRGFISNMDCMPCSSLIEHNIYLLCFHHRSVSGLHHRNQQMMLAAELQQKLKS